jgi:hypothetical protein
VDLLDSSAETEIEIMPTYPSSLTQGQILSGLNYGPSGNPYAPYGEYGPRYDLQTNDIGLRINTLTPGQWQQVPSEAGNRSASYYTTPGGPRSGAAGGINPLTGQPFTYSTGTAGGVGGGTTVPFSGGQQINPNDPYQRYRAVNIVKTPEIESATQKMLKQFEAVGNSDVADFSKYLTDFKAQLDSAANRGNAALNLDPYIQAQRGYQSKYAQNLGGAAADYAALNAATGANSNRIIEEQKAMLPSYNTAQDALRDYNAKMLTAATVARYGPNLSSGLGRELVRGYSQISVPLELAKIQQGYRVSDAEMAAATEQANRETARIGSFNPMVAGQTYQSGHATEQDILNAQMQAANLGFEYPMRYLQGATEAYMAPQRLFSGRIGQLGALDQLYGSSRYQGLQDVLGTNVTPAQSYSFISPGYPARTPYRAPVGTGVDYGVATASTAGAVPGTRDWTYTDPYAQSIKRYKDMGWDLDAAAGVWRNRLTGEVKPTTY